MKLLAILLKSVFFPNFISHTVQMKLASRGAFCQTPSSPLYPTRFRWNIKWICAMIISMSCFISHTVQMKPLSSFSCWHASRLYIPHGSDETFLMKPIVWKTTALLYIPHGSDETILIVYRRHADTKLYIPHGSDETKRMEWAASESHRTLYPTRFRWNLNIKMVSFT